MRLSQLALRLSATKLSNISYNISHSRARESTLSYTCQNCIQNSAGMRCSGKNKTRQRDRTRHRRRRISPLIYILLLYKYTYTILY